MTSKSLYTTADNGKLIQRSIRDFVIKYYLFLKFILETQHYCLQYVQQIELFTISFYTKIYQ